MHEHIKVGDILLCEAPRNTFALKYDAARYVLIAGGIGITAILPMADELWSRGKSLALTYLARGPEEAAFVDELAAASYKRAVRIHFSCESGRLDPDSIIGSHSEGAAIYCCGPQSLVDAVRNATTNWPSDAVNFEHFSAPAVDASGPAFRVRLSESTKEYMVPPGRSILQVLRENGFELASMCEQGVCGSCLTPVVDGLPDHRDCVLSPAEKEANDIIAICCSRAKSELLVLDI